MAQDFDAVHLGVLGTARRTIKVGDRGVNVLGDRARLKRRSTSWAIERGRKVDPQQVERKRREIAEAAARLFSLQGYENTSVANVAREVGASSATVVLLLQGQGIPLPRSLRTGSQCRRRDSRTGTKCR
ncbi:helix-turn-helix domain-containing protein [Corynebacterium sp. A21]|uniref:helix-turn-helix domain-containing protein n=1 Tax=Corynebacterium sp. A21 TaxID=3457318 RepID=UPI003FD2FF07